MEDHFRLEQCLRNTPHKFFLTYEDAPEIREMYSWANIYDLNFAYRVDDSSTNDGKRSTGTELIVTNYKLQIQDFFGNE